jgi:hypothetical protein
MAKTAGRAEDFCALSRFCGIRHTAQSEKFPGAQATFIFLLVLGVGQRRKRQKKGQECACPVLCS